MIFGLHMIFWCPINHFYDLLKWLRKQRAVPLSEPSTYSMTSADDGDSCELLSSGLVSLNSIYTRSNIAKVPSSLTVMPAVFSNTTVG